jgi:transcription elongation factor GreA-like protein
MHVSCIYNPIGKYVFHKTRGGGNIICVYSDVKLLLKFFELCKSHVICLLDDREVCSFKVKSLEEH